uniref:Uncharacterized protein n=1 Tax=Brassica campestris TaxID=3711 RepID=M4F3Z6_BRACM
MAGDPYLRPPPHPPCPPTPPVPDPSSFPPLPASPISPPFAPMSFSTHHSPWNLPLVNAPGFGSSALVSGTPITLQLATAEGDSNITHVSTEHAVPTNPVVSSDLGIPAPTLNSSSPLLRITDPFPQSQPQQNTIAVDLSTDSGPSVLPGGPSPSLPPIIPHHPFLPTPVSVDGILLTPPSSPPSPPAAVFSQASSENSYSPPSKITHLLALPAVHHSRPINTKFFKKPPSPSHSLPPSKSILSLNPFACLALQSSTPSTVTESAPSLDPPPLSPPSFTSITPAVGSFLSEGETHNL